MEENRSPFGSREIARKKDKLAFISFAKQIFTKAWLRVSISSLVDDGSGDDNDSDEADGEDEEVFEVEKVLRICYGDPKEIKNTGIIS